MKEKLTKFQTKVWRMIEPIIKKESYQVNLTFDDEFIITKESKYVITIFPNKQISLKNKNESIFFDETNLTDLISFLES
jgi:hypothetical protein